MTFTVHLQSGMADVEVSMATVPITKPTAQQVSHAIITAAMKVHTELGPGLLESASARACSTNLRKRACCPLHKWDFRLCIQE
jgi:hypothetical protein